MVDDRQDILLAATNHQAEELILQAFAQAGLDQRVHCVHDGAQAIEYVFCTGMYSKRRFEDRPRLVLLDLNLPYVDELEVLQALKTDPRTRAIPVVVLANDGADRLISESYRLGANSCLVKPSSLEHFADTVRQLTYYWTSLNYSTPNDR